MKLEIKQPWITSGYTIFANEGPKGLKIEVLARVVTKNKSSFYHHFADVTIFTEELLQYHLVQSKIIAQKIAQCKSINPDLIAVLLEVKTDILFNRQLRIHRDVPSFQNCFIEANRPVEAAFLDIWAEALGLKTNPALAKMILNLTIENFYLQITEKNLNATWLINYLNEIRAMVLALDPKS